MLSRLCCLPVNAAIPAKANKEAQNEAKKDDQQQGQHVEHLEIPEGPQVRAGTICNRLEPVGYAVLGGKSSGGVSLCPARKVRLTPYSNVRIIMHMCSTWARNANRVLTAVAPNGSEPG